MNKIVLIPFILFFGCKKNINRNGFFSTKEYFLEIRKDSSFIFENKASHFYSHNKGTWNRNLNKEKLIYLKAESTNLEYKIKLVKLDSSGKSKIKTFVKTIDNNKSLKNINCSIFSDNKAIFYGNCDKIPEILNKEVKTIQYYFDYVSDSTTRSGGGKLSDIININPDMNIEIKFCLDISKFNKTTFNSTKTMFKRNKVILFDFDQKRKVVLKEFTGDTQHFFERY